MEVESLLCKVDLFCAASIERAGITFNEYVERIAQARRIKERAQEAARKKNKMPCDSALRVRCTKARAPGGRGRRARG